MRIKKVWVSFLSAVITASRPRAWCESFESSPFPSESPSTVCRAGFLSSVYLLFTAVVTMRRRTRPLDPVSKQWHTSLWPCSVSWPVHRPAEQWMFQFWLSFDFSINISVILYESYKMFHLNQPLLLFHKDAFAKGSTVQNKLTDPCPPLKYKICPTLLQQQIPDANKNNISETGFILCFIQHLYWSTHNLHKLITHQVTGSSAQSPRVSDSNLRQLTCCLISTRTNQLTALTCADWSSVVQVRGGSPSPPPPQQPPWRK